jgi:membrane-bound serine protease (ClpP class)
MTGREGLVGEQGRAIGELAPDGKVAVHGEYWDARAVGGPIAAGTPVRVLAVGQRRIDVEPAVVAGEGSE